MVSRRFQYSVLSLVLLSVLGACSTAKVRVLPGEDGLHSSVALDIERDGADTAAIDAAKEYCEERNRTAVFSSQSSKYRGSMEESTRNTIRGASKAASMIGGFTSPVSDAGRAGMTMTSDRDYEAKVKFRCK